MNYFNYFSEIEETFIRRRGKNLFLSPLDWALMESWQERQIPLHLILRSIEKVFDNHQKSNKKRSVKSLAFCSEEIEAQYEEWLESQIGKDATAEQSDNKNDDSMFSKETIENHLVNIKSQLESAKLNLKNSLAESIQRVLNRLDELEKTFTDAENLEYELSQLEQILDESLLKDSIPETLERFSLETAKELHNYQKTMEKEVFQKTFDLLLLKKLRLDAGIPRLSLFYL